MKISKVLLGSLLLLTACSKTVETPSGFEFKLAKEGEGKPAGPNELIIFNFKITDSKDSVWINSYDRGFPEITAAADSSQMKQADGITQMLNMMKKGDSAVFEISVKKLFKEMVRNPIPPHVDSTLNLTYSISVRDIILRDSFENYRSKLEQEYKAFEEKSTREQLAKDTVAIDDYLKSKGITAQKLPSGIRYVITQPGTDANAASGQTVLVNYAGYLMDGRYFDTNVKAIAQEKGIYDSLREAQMPYQPFEVIIDRSSLISGWHEVLKLLNKGAKGTFYIPSTLAYGKRQMDDKIKANTSLIFDIEMVEIKPAEAPVVPVQ